jgi:hypothetical protein
MNRNKLFQPLFVKKDHRNAFISQPSCTFQKSQRVEQKMKRIIAAMLAALIAVSALSLAASAYAMPFMNWNRFTNIGPIRQRFGMLFPGNSNRTSLQASLVRLEGIATKFGTTNVTGTVLAQARTLVINGTDIRQGSSATAIWTTNTSRPINAIRAKENFTYSFYAARLVTPQIAGLNVDVNDFYLNGTWTVYNVTTTFNINTDASGNVIGFNRNQNAVALATQKYGELTVTGNWATFTLSITGVEALTGSVHAQRITQRMFNPFIIGTGDSTAVTPSDVASIASAYGAMPGYGNYDQRMDYNFNYRIDICDLATAAANVNQ